MIMLITFHSQTYVSEGQAKKKIDNTVYCDNKYLPVNNERLKNKSGVLFVR